MVFRSLMVACGLMALTPVAAQAQFMTAAEVRPILDMTTQNWVAVRDYNGQDLVYFTHLEMFRCGLAGVRYGINGEPASTPYGLEECYENTSTPNAIHPESHSPYVVFPSGTVQSITVDVNYDDGTVNSVTFFRSEIMTP